jgi:LPXTG-motif cell wall-anchored protein
MPLSPQNESKVLFPLEQNRSTLESSTRKELSVIDDSTLRVILGLAAVVVLGLYLLRRRRKAGNQRRLARYLKESLESPETKRGKVA